MWRGTRKFVGHEQVFFSSFFSFSQTANTSLALTMRINHPDEPQNIFTRSLPIVNSTCHRLRAAAVKLHTVGHPYIFSNRRFDVSSIHVAEHYDAYLKRLSTQLGIAGFFFFIIGSFSYIRLELATRYVILCRQGASQVFFGSHIIPTNNDNISGKEGGKK